MNCGMECVKYLLFIFNFVFALGGLAILICGVLIHVSMSDLDVAKIDIPISMPVIVLIIVGAVIFIIAFFGCCGAIRESHCMIVTFAVLLLTLLVVQVAIASYALVQFKRSDVETKINNLIDVMVEHYYDKEDQYKVSMNAIQTFASCCGAKSYHDFLENSNNHDGDLPYSCCQVNENQKCSKSNLKFYKGCKETVYPSFKKLSNILAGLAIGIAAIELIGIIFSFCLANSIRNVQRRGYKV